MLLALALLGQAQACTPTSDPYTEVCVDRSGADPGAGNCVSKQSETITLTESFTLSERSLVQLDDLTLTAQGYYGSGANCPVEIGTLTLRINSTTVWTETVNALGPQMSTLDVHITRSFSPSATDYVELAAGSHTASLVVTGITTDATSELRARFQAALRYGRDFDGDAFDSDLLSDCGSACDCDDTDDLINPDADEICDDVDNDCDDTIDIGAIDADTWWLDDDGDGYGTASTSIEACDAPADHVANDDDCDDANAAINPLATEIAGDGVDQDCDLEELCFSDGDGDGFRTDTTTATTTIGCDTGALRLASTPDGDCNDADAAINPDATEIIADGVDQDCDTLEVCYVDGDDDGYRTDGTTTSADLGCAAAGLALGSAPDGDCNDGNAAINPGATEICDDVDNDCDTEIDVGAVDAPTWYLDTDGDGFGIDADTTTACDAPSGYVADDGDCDDGSASIYPGAFEIIADGEDQDCDLEEICYEDGDEDGFRTDATTTTTDIACAGAGLALESLPDGDCDDADDATFPDATEIIADGKDQDCDLSEICYADGDDDGFRTDTTTTTTDVACAGAGLALASAPDGDCDDGDPDISPGADEIVADGVDQDCDALELCYADGDGDGFRTDAATESSDLTCTGEGWALVTDPAGDCDDDDDVTYPGATEVVADGKDQSCDGEEICYEDRDDDGVRTDTTTATTDVACAGSGVALASATAGDCDDDDSVTYPGATEIIADGKDQSCDGEETCYEDRDNDGFRTDETTATTTVSCIGGGLALASSPGDDCDDDDSETFPDAEELVADGKDQSCDGFEACYRDGDNDGFRTDAAAATDVIGCDTDGWALASVPGVDCDDGDDLTFPGAEEVVADGKDQSCDGLESCFEDLDDDGFRTDVTTETADIACAGAGVADAATADGDCDDTDDAIRPDAEEIWYDAVDQDCDGGSDFDQDLDGFDSDAHERPDGTFGEDCDDLDDAIRPDAEEIWYDAVDQDCDGGSDFDRDGDGFDARDVTRPDGTVGDDCDDLDDTVFPGVRGLAEDCTVLVEQDGSRGLPPPAPEVQPGPVGCACDQTSAPAGGFALALALLGLVVRRRR
jgi:hypothetical protein